MLQDLQTGLMYNFELNKKLHNRSTYDQWKEIAVKPLTDVTNHSETAFIESQLIQPLPGQCLDRMIVYRHYFVCCI